MKPGWNRLAMAQKEMTRTRNSEAGSLCESVTGLNYDHYAARIIESRSLLFCNPTLLKPEVSDLVILMRVAGKKTKVP